MSIQKISKLIAAVLSNLIVGALFTWAAANDVNLSAMGIESVEATAAVAFLILTAVNGLAVYEAPANKGTK